ncbi:MAG: HSP20 family small heat-shock protein [Actinomycetota bacterium]|jgi:HSP20 family protein|nr:HSP20 family small heat-shock protein [Actinomycetota bacterium]
MALVRSDPFRDIDRLLQQLWRGPDGAARPSALAMPMDAWRSGDRFTIELDLPGVDPDAVEMTVEDNVLVVKADRPHTQGADDDQLLIAERPYGTFTRQVFLGDNLDTDNIEATYLAGVLRLTIPVAPQAKARRIPIHHEPERADQLTT